MILIYKFKSNNKIIFIFDYNVKIITLDSRPRDYLLFIQSKLVANAKVYNIINI